MTKVKQLQRKHSSRRFTPYSSSSDCSKSCDEVLRKKGCKQVSGKGHLVEGITCSVCMEFPHNAVLLLCSSHDKGCRPFMCATGHQFSNCLEQYKKANTKVISSKSTPSYARSSYDPGFTVDSLDGKSEVSELLCPLCRGQVKGWTVVAPIRKRLNAKRRTCMQDGCTFLGSYRELRKHVKAVHPRTRPRDVDPVLSEKWKKLENEREREDVFSTIRSTMPGSIVVGDYVIERNYGSFSRHYDSDDYWESDDDMESFLRSPSYSRTMEDFETARTRVWGRLGRANTYRSGTRVRRLDLSLMRSRRQHRRIRG